MNKKEILAKEEFVERLWHKVPEPEETTDARIPNVFCGIEEGPTTPVHVNRAKSRMK
jgi:hypothetical protein